jgi:hypothetical protein
MSLLRYKCIILKLTNNIAECCEFLHDLNSNLVNVCIYFCIEITEFVMLLLTMITLL